MFPMKRSFIDNVIIVTENNYNNNYNVLHQIIQLYEFTIKQLKF